MVEVKNEDGKRLLRVEVSLGSWSCRRSSWCYFGGGVVVVTVVVVFIGCFRCFCCCAVVANEEQKRCSAISTLFTARLSQIAAQPATNSCGHGSPPPTFSRPQFTEPGMDSTWVPEDSEQICKANTHLNKRVTRDHRCGAPGSPVPFAIAVFASNAACVVPRRT